MNMSKIFVLDTSVLLFDHNAILNFEDNNIVIPITVLEELDNFKIGNDTKNFEAREVIRNLDKLTEHKGLNEWLPLGEKLGKLKIFNSQVENLQNDAEKIYGKGKGDHKIINAALDLKQQDKKSKVVLVTKDINLRLKAKALGLNAEDYLTGRVENVNTVSEGFTELNNLDAEVIARLYNERSIKEDNLLKGNKIANKYYWL